MALGAALAESGRRRREQVGALAELIRIPSVSSDPRRRDDVRRAAGWLSGRLRASGLSVRLLPPRESPIVLGSWRGDPRHPTLLIYGHYDVVAPEPLSAWRRAPFDPAVAGGFIHGRGSSDDKGPVVCQLSALAAWARSAHRLPLNVLCLFEGQEEIGSHALRALLARRPSWLHADAVLVCDTRMLGPGQPTLIHGLRGSVSAELTVVAAPQDLHSGAFGGAVRNAAHVLCQLVASLHDSRGRIAIPGFYGRVLPARALTGRRDELDRALLAGSRTSKQLHFGEAGFSAHERTTLRPSLDVNGLVAGHIGRGGKSIVPGRATAKVSFRLVPDQDPAEVISQLRHHLLAHTPPGVRLELKVGKRAPPYLGDPRNWANRAAADVLRASFGRSPVLLRSGGSIPVVEAFARSLGAPVVLMGFASPDDGMHGPNERFSLDSFARGTEACIRLLDRVAASAPGPRSLVAVPA